jgi:hypothetical protein
VAGEHDEAILGESSLAAPVFDATGTAVGAVSVVMPSSEWPPTDTMRDDLRETARNISRELGATTWPVSAQPPNPPPPDRAHTRDPAATMSRTSAESVTT